MALAYAFAVDVPANSVVAVQVPLGGETDLLDARLRRDWLAALASATARAATASAEAVELKRLLSAPPGPVPAAGT